jgi:hypothetical protein
MTSNPTNEANNFETVLYGKKVFEFAICIDMFTLMIQKYPIETIHDILLTIDNLLSPHDEFQNPMVPTDAEHLFQAYLATSPPFHIDQQDLFNCYQIWVTMFNSSGFRKIMDYLFSITERSDEKQILNDLFLFWQLFYNQSNGHTIEILADEDTVLKGGAKLFDFAFIFILILPFVMIFFSEGYSSGKMNSFLALVTVQSPPLQPLPTPKNELSAKILEERQISIMSVAVRGYVDRYVTPTMFENRVFRTFFRRQVNRKIKEIVSLNATAFTENLAKTKEWLEFVQQWECFGLLDCQTVVDYNRYIDNGIMTVNLLKDFPIQILQPKIAEVVLPPIMRFLYNQYWYNPILQYLRNFHIPRINIKSLTKLIMNKLLSLLPDIKRFLANSKQTLKRSGNKVLETLKDPSFKDSLRDSVQHVGSEIQRTYNDGSLETWTKNTAKTSVSLGRDFVGNVVRRATFEKGDDYSRMPGGGKRLKTYKKLKRLSRRFFKKV